MNQRGLEGYKDLILYYKNLNIVKESEFEQFEKILLEQLPISFRINQTRQFKDKIEKQFEDAIQSIKNETGVTPLAKQNILNQDIYTFQIPTKELKKDKRFKAVNQALNTNTVHSNVFRQEFVSMLPAGLLNINSSHKVLDMCAAPGSKTIQLIEKFSSDLANNKKERNSQGFIVANELDSQRANLLAFQTLKIKQNFLMITNQDACTLPENETFDRIICDVPCSGDGTVRKNEMIKKAWTPKFGLKLHELQLKLLLKGLNLLEKDGIIAYSTCSMNPVEDESVLNAAVQLMGLDNVEIIDIKDQFGKFKVNPALTDWKVYVKRGKKELNQDWFENYDQVKELKRCDRVIPSMLPDFKGATNRDYLKNAVRILPHDNNTGGFFIALLRKKTSHKVDLEVVPSLLKKQAKPSEEAKKEDETTTSDNNIEIEDSQKASVNQEESKASTDQEEVTVKKTRNYLTSLKGVNETLAPAFSSFFGITEKYWSENLYYLNEARKRLLHISPQLAKYVATNENNDLRIVQVGNKYLERLRDGECTAQLRVLFEGVEDMIGDITKQKMIVEQETFQKLLSDFSKNITELDFTGYSFGPCIISVKDLEAQLSIIVWKGRKNITLLIGKEEIHYLEFLVAEIYTLNKKE